jgi:ribosomal protein S18 acetylase RimI-like enzyme
VTTAAAIELRPLSSTDAAAFREIRLEGLQQDPDAFGSTHESESAQPLSFFADRLDRTAVFGAFRGSELLGVAGFAVQPGPKHAHKGLLWGMYVRPRAREIGIARRLAEAVIEHARSRVELLQLSVVSENAAARRLYTSLGFEEYGIDRRGAKYQGRYHDDVLMVKMLVLDSATGPAAQSRGDDP